MRFLLSLALAATAFGQTPGLQTVQANKLRADLAFLSGDALEGRNSLSRGSEVAIDWIASEFTKAGLQPISNGSYLQKVPLVEYQPDRAATKLTLTRGGQPIALARPLGGFPHDVTVSAPAVFAGYGITAPELHYDDYAGLDARGKIVVLLAHEPQDNDPKSIFNGTGNTRYANATAKLLNAQQHGAVGVVQIAEPYSRHHPNQPEPDTSRVVRPQPQFLADGEITIPLLSLTEKNAAELFQGTGKTLADLQAAIDRTGQPASLPLAGATLEMKLANKETRSAFSANVIGLLEGSDPSLKNDTIIYSAHFDHDGIVAGQLLHGADDNGSGTVGVVALAHAFAANPVRPKRSILFAVFAAEEKGLLGSYYYVAHPLRPLATTKAVINFDMIGRNEAHVDSSRGVIDIAADTSNELNLVGLPYSPDYYAAVEKANQQIGLKLNDKFDRDASMNILFRSDQYPFLLHSIPALWWFTGLHPDYHKPTDTVEKINFPKMEKILKLAYLTGWSFANGETPRFQAVRSE